MNQSGWNKPNIKSIYLGLMGPTFTTFFCISSCFQVCYHEYICDNQKKIVLNSSFFKLVFKMGCGV